MKTVVGWGTMQGDEKCRDPENTCKGKGDSVVYVQYEDGDMIPSCKECTPPRSCLDPIAKVFETFLSPTR